MTALVYGLRLAAPRAGGHARPRAGLLELAAAWRRRPRSLRAGAAALLAALIIVAAGALLASPAPPRALTVRFLDVGQGDATLIQDAAGAAVLFDGGPPEARVVPAAARGGGPTARPHRGHTPVARPPGRPA